MTNIMSLKADVHYGWVSFALWRRLALKDYWANRAPEKTCTPQSVIRALIEGITWEPAALIWSCKLLPLPKILNKEQRSWKDEPPRQAPGHCLSTAHPSWITWAQHHITLNPGWPESWGEAAVCVEKKKKSLQTFSCDTIKYLVFKLHLSYHNQLRNVSVHMFKFWWKSLDSINIWKYVLCCHLSFFSFPKKTSYSWEAKLVLLVWPSWKVSHRFFSVVILLRKRSVSQP